MKFLPILFASLVIPALGVVGRGQKRNLAQFYDMIKKQTGRGPFETYINYACWCGVTAGGNVLDETDQCCKTHDLCYNEAATLYLWGYVKCSPKFHPYVYSADENEISCGRWNNNCLMKICQCDKAAAECFKQQLHTYDAALYNLDDEERLAKCGKV